MKIPNVWITVGKRGFDDENLEKIKNYTISGIRINTGRSSFEWAYQTISKLISMGYKAESIFLDIGNQKPRISLKNYDKLEVEKSDIITIVNNISDMTDVSLNNSTFFEKVILSDIVYFGDGEIEGSVVEIFEGGVKVKLLSSGCLTNNISVGIKNKEFTHFYVAPDEIKAVNKILSDFPICLILSFVENMDNILWAKKMFPKAYAIIPKIETKSAVDNFASIVSIAPCIFIGRGDLGLAMGIEKLGIIQKKLVTMAHKEGCHVAVGTGTLDSLKWSQVPLRAEIIDITNSCYEEVDIIVLTSETAGSKQPFKSVDFLMEILSYIRMSM